MNPSDTQPCDRAKKGTQKMLVNLYCWCEPSNVTVLIFLFGVLKAINCVGMTCQRKKWKNKLRRREGMKSEVEVVVRYRWFGCGGWWSACGISGGNEGGRKTIKREMVGGLEGRRDEDGEHEPGRAQLRRMQTNRLHKPRGHGELHMLGLAGRVLHIRDLQYPPETEAVARPLDEDGKAATSGLWSAERTKVHESAKRTTQTSTETSETMPGVGVVIVICWLQSR